MHGRGYWCSQSEAASVCPQSDQQGHGRYSSLRAPQAYLPRQLQSTATVSEEFLLRSTALILRHPTCCQ